MTSPFQDEASSSATPGENIPGPYDEVSRVLAAMPRPRPVRMSRRGKMTAAVVSVALLFAVGAFTASLFAQKAAAGRNAAPTPFLNFVLPVGMVLVIVPIMLRTLGQQKLLLAEGEMTTARVTKKWAARNGPNIRYEFTTPLGEHFSRSASDGSRQLSVGMNVPLFYDSQRPKKQLALCASFYEVVTPGEDSYLKGS